MSSLLRLLILAGAVLAMAPSVLLLCTCTTREGAVFAVAALLLCSSVALGSVARGKAAARLGLAAGLAFAGWAAGTAWLAARAPDGHTPAGSPVVQRYVGGKWGFRRYVLGNLLPEQDQFAMGLNLIPFADSLFTMRQARAMSAMTKTIYGELEADPNFHALGSAMPEAYDDLWRQPIDHGHYFLYIPPGLDRRQPHPMLVFLHGSGGNFKSYTWLLSKVADQLGLVLIAPSYGMGNWRGADTEKLVTMVLDDVAQVVALDRAQLHLAGLSNGGLGVSQAGRSMGSNLRSLIFLSPVFDEVAIDSAEFGRQWRGRPVLVISGKEDDRIPSHYVVDNTQSMSRAGISVTLHPVEGADHFMMFSHREPLRAMLVEWLKPLLSKR